MAKELTWKNVTSWSPLSSAASRLLQDNSVASGAIMNGRDYSKFLTLEASDNQPREPHKLVENLPLFETSSRPINYSCVGTTASDGGRIIVANWDDVGLGVRLNFTIGILDQLYAADYATGFVAALRADTQVFRKQSVEIISNISPTAST